MRLFSERPGCCETTENDAKTPPDNCTIAARDHRYDRVGASPCNQFIVTAELTYVAVVE